MFGPSKSIASCTSFVNQLHIDILSPQFYQQFSPKLELLCCTQLQPLDNIYVLTHYLSIFENIINRSVCELTIYMGEQVLKA